MTCKATPWPPRPSHRPCKHRFEFVSNYVSIVPLVLVSWIIIPAVTCQSVDTANPDGICGSIDIRNNPSNLAKLAKCSVIEGSLHIVLMEHATPESYENVTFPNLIEITDYLLVWKVHGLTTLSKMFPNLAVIRGRKLFYNYALVIFNNPDLKDIGTSNLTRIERGAVKIEKNNNLCFADSINWYLIAPGRDSTRPPQHSIKENMDSNNCPSCPVKCPKVNETSLCWREEQCQRVCDAQCTSNACFVNNSSRCCHSSCLGGCHGPSPKDCIACTNVVYKGMCMNKCPPGDGGSPLLDFLDRRCITVEECLQKKPEKVNEKFIKYKTVNISDSQHKCLLECPQNSEEDPNDPTKCKICSQNRCPKVCRTSKSIQNIADVQKLRGCVKIIGDIVISTRSNGDIVHELEENLKDIESISGYLKIIHSPALVTLYFFSKLQVIEGHTLERHNYSVYIVDNSNLQKLFPPNNTVKIKRGRGFFHINPRLCLSEIEAVSKNAIEHDWDARDVSPSTNGDRIECQVVEFNVSVTHTPIHQNKKTTAVLVTWQNMGKSFGDYRSLLGYTIFYRKADHNITKFEGRDACAKNDWNSVDINQNDETSPLSWIIPGLSYHKRYAIYIETIGFDSKTKAESELVYFVTPEGVPSEPTDIHVNYTLSDTLTVTWSPPLKPQGVLHSYIVELSPIAPYSEGIHSGKGGIGEIKDRCVSEHLNPSARKTPSNEPKVNVWKNNNDTVNSFINKITSSNNKVDRDKFEQCCLDCMKTETTITSADDAFSAKGFEDYLIDELFFKRSSGTKVQAAAAAAVNEGAAGGGTSTAGRSRRDVDSSTASTDLATTTVQANDSSTSLASLPVSSPPPRKVISQTIFITDPSIKQWSATFTNLTHFTAYDISIRACLAPRNNSAYCSDPPGEIRHRTKPISENDDVLNTSLIVESNNSSTPTVIIEWTEPPSPNGLALAYELEWRLVSKTTAGLGSSRCISSGYFKKLGNKFKLEDQVSGEYEIKVRTRSLAGYGAWSEPLLFTIPEKHSSALVMYIVIGFIFFAFVGISVSTSWFVLNKSKENSTNMEYVSMNPEYMSSYVADEWEIDRDQTKILGELGQGSFGMVYEGALLNVVPGRPEHRCAIKTVNEGASCNDRVQFLNEASIMKSFNCHHVVKLLGVVSKSPVLVCMELMEYGDLRNYLRACRDGGPPGNYARPTRKRVDIMSSQIADGMAYLAIKKFVHRDLAARNCMVNSSLTVKIGDFGMTRDIYETDYYRKGNRGMLPVRWMAPESLKDGVFTSKSDVWAFGVVLWEIVTLGEQPYQGLSNEQVLKYVMRGGLQECPEGCPEDLFDLMKSCWAWKPADRPNFTDIIDRINVDDPDFKQTSFYFNEFPSSAGQNVSNDETAPLNASSNEDDRAQYELNRLGEGTLYFPSCVVNEEPICHDTDDPQQTTIRVENDDNSNETRNGLNGIPGNKNNSSDESKGSKISNGSVINGGLHTSSAC